ncbi:MAG: protein kinase [Streptosporangiales bacterium]|nr:protein kinase [Streptosporangiales bacterium]
MQRIEPGDPRRLGRYRVLARIGAGGMAIVYLARSPGGRAVAVKVMHAELAREREYRDRFRREVAAATAAGGMHSPPVLDADPEAATPWMTTEFLPSVTLREAVERSGPLPAGSVRLLAAGLAEALAAIHRAGIVHLDVKPANVLLTTGGLRLIDFGIAAGARPGVSAGSWGYMSPEQVAGHAGPPSDVYSLGATLAFAATGQAGEQPGDDTLRELIAACRQADPAARPTAAELSDRLARAMRDPYETAGWLPPAVLAGIDARASEAANPPPVPRLFPGRRALLIGGGAAAVAAVAGGAAAMLADSGPPPAKASEGVAKATQAAPSTPAASPTPTPDPVTVEFVITGGGPLSALAYAINGDLTKLEGDVELPWRKKVTVPRPPGSLDYRLRYTFPAGRVRHRVLIDGDEVEDMSHPVNPAFGYPYDVDTGGSRAFSGPIPSAGG